MHVLLVRALKVPTHLPKEDATPALGSVEGKALSMFS
jgi:hypothetical protein